MQVEGQVSISLAEYHKLLNKISELEKDNRRLNNIMKIPEVISALHQPE